MKKKTQTVVAETNQNPLPSMKTVTLEVLMLDVIVSFCENAAELGCPREKEVDMWIRELEDKNAIKVMEKLFDIMGNCYHKSANKLHKKTPKIKNKDK